MHRRLHSQIPSRPARKRDARSAAARYSRDMPADSDTTPALNWNSSRLTQGWQRGINAFFWGLGFQPDDFHKAQIGIATPLLDGNLCNVHAHEIARAIQTSCKEQGLIGFPFGVSPISDKAEQ